MNLRRLLLPLAGGPRPGTPGGGPGAADEKGKKR